MTDASLTLNWSAVTQPEGIEIKNYEVFRDGTSIGTRVGTSFADSGLTGLTEYSYQVKAISIDGTESGLSEELSVTTESTPEPEV